MHLVGDASLLVEVLRPSPSGDAARGWLTTHLAGDELYTIRGFTILEISNVLRKIVFRDPADEWWAEIAQSQVMQLPSTRMEVTQAMMIRIWELRPNHSSYDAAQIALAEQLQGEHGGNAALATADVRLSQSKTALCTILLFP